MTDDEIRALVRAKLVDGTLLRQRPGDIARDVDVALEQPICPLVTDGTFQDPCAVCDGTLTQVRYDSPRGSGRSLAFHKRCWEIWLEEIDRR